MKHYDIIYKIEKERETFDVPVPLPNNLKKIKKLLEFTDKELAEKLNWKQGYINLVNNNKQDFSGKGIVKILKELNITFSMLYDINDKVNVDVETVKDYIVIINLKQEFENEKQLIEVLLDIIKNKLQLNPDEENIKVKPLELNVVDNKFSIENLQNLKDVPQSISEWYCEELQELTPKGKYIYFIGIQQFSKKEKEITIKTQEKIDKEMSIYLSKAPFNKVLLKIVNDEIIKNDGKNIVLKNEYKAITSKGVIETNTFTSKDFLKKDDKYFIFLYDKNNYVNNKIRLYRLKNNYSINYMSEILGVLPESYRLIEAGHNRLSAKQMWIIENELGILLESIYDIDNVD